MNKKLTASEILSYTKYALAGGIGGVAVVNTYFQVIAANPSPNAEAVAMAVGAALLAGAAKVLHAV